MHFYIGTANTLAAATAMCAFLLACGFAVVNASMRTDLC
jgi:hypothetical protein